MPSVLTPYRTSSGNNPYTQAQLKELWADLEPKAREPGKYSLEERVKLQRAFLEYVVQGFTATRAVQRLQDIASREPGKMPYADYATFMVWKEYDKDFSDAYEVAYAMGTDQLEDKAVELAYGGNATMLQFLLRVRNPQRYNPKQEVSSTVGGQVEHVHRVEIVAAKPREVESRGGRDHVPQIAPNGAEYVDAEVVDDG